MNTASTSREPQYDVVVVGGGAAGLSGALSLARARRTVLVIDAGRPRNAPAAHVHNYLTQDGVPPSDLLAAGRAEVTGYGGEVQEGEVVSVRRAGGGFVVTLDGGRTVRARRLLVTTGLHDELPDVPGLSERWGRDVLHCPYCHGWEVRDQPIGILGTTPFAAHQALMWRQWSADVTVFTHTGPRPPEEELEQLAARDIAVVDGPVTGLDVAGDRLTGVRLGAAPEPAPARAGGAGTKEGRSVPCRALVVSPVFSARTGVLGELGLEAADQEMGGHIVGRQIPAAADGATSVPGVWVAGNATNMLEQVIGAAAGGNRAAASINADLTAEDTRHAVEARRDSFSRLEEREVCERLIGDRGHGL